MRYAQARDRHALYELGTSTSRTVVLLVLLVLLHAPEAPPPPLGHAEFSSKVKEESYVEANSHDDAGGIDRLILLSTIAKMACFGHVQLFKHQSHLVTRI